MYRPISKLTGGALAATGAVLAICAVATVLLLATSTPSSAAPTASAARPHASGRQTSTPTASSASATTILTRKTAIGTILVGPGGETLYAFTRDGHNRDVCASVHGCLAVWPMITIHGSPSPGHGVNRSLLGTITVHGAHQITYAGHPLYSYAQAGGPGDTSYVGATQFGGSWPAINPTGHFVH